MATKKIKSFDRPTLRKLRVDLDKEFKKIGTKFGINLSLGSMSFGETKFTTRMTATVKTPSTTAKVTLKKKFTDTVSLYFPNINGTKAFGGKFLFKGRTYTVNDVKTSRPRFPFSCTRDDGSGFKFPKDVIERNFPKK